METKVKNREWVKDAAIVFLAVLLVLTFFSNTIMNRSLPEVATAQVTNGAIVAKVRGTGTVTATGKHQVKAKETRTIRSVMIKAGQEVNTGDVLFVLGEGDVTELEAAREALREMEYAYQKSAVSIPNFDYSSYNRAIANAENKLAQAEKAANDAHAVYMRVVENGSTGESLEQINAQIEKVREELNSTEKELEAAESAFNERYAKAVDEVRRCQEAFDERYKQVMESSSASTPESEGAGEGEEAVASAPLFNDPELQLRWEQLQNAEAQLASLDKSSDAYLNSLTNKYAELQSRYEALVKHSQQSMPEKAIPYKEAWDAAEAALLTALAEVEDAYAARDFAVDSNNKTASVSYIDLQQQAEKIKLQQEKIKSLAGDEENVITANVSGTIDTVDCTAGDTVLKDALLCTVEVPDMGHTLSFSVTNDQAQRLRVGDTASISNYYWGNSITATLSSIRTDPKNPQSNKVLTFDLTGDVTSGSELTISVGQKSANYDLVVPNSAIKSDSNGSFVLVVSAKSSPLGNRYTARRVGVEVLANDDTNSAVVAELSNGDYVITTSSAPLNSGDMVRMADSGD